MANEFEVPCPLLVAVTDYDELITKYQPCEEALYLTYATSYGLGPVELTNPEYVDPDAFGPNGAHTAAWQIECANGHVLLTSDSQDEDARFRPADAAKLRELIDRIQTHA